MEFIVAAQFGNELSDVDKAQENDFPIIDEQLKKLNSVNEIIYFNINEVKYIGYSYAKQTFRKAIMNVFEDKYNAFTICFKYDQDEYEKKFDGLIYALNQRLLSTYLISENFQYPKILGYLAISDPRDTQKEKSNKKNQKDVIEYILKKKEAFTNDIAVALDLKLPNTNRILKELEEKRLIKREKVTSPSGGPIYLNKSIFTT